MAVDPEIVEGERGYVRVHGCHDDAIVGSRYECASWILAQVARRKNKVSDPRLLLERHAKQRPVTE
jgi:hypothetical protein